MERVIEILTELFNHLSTSGELIQKYDALLLTAIELPERARDENLIPFSENSDDTKPLREEDPSSNPSGIGEGISGLATMESGGKRIIKLNGLSKITSEISDILNFGIIHQQVILGKLRNEVHELTELVEEMRAKFQEVEKKNDWESLPPAHSTSSSSFADISLYENSSTIALIKKEFHSKFQRLYNEAYAILQIKTKAFELVDAILSRYTDNLAKLAEDSNIADAIERTQFIVKQNAMPLLSHRFMDTTQTRDLIQSIQAQVSSSYMRGHRDLADCKLSIQSQPVETSIFHVLSFKIGVGLILLFWAISECTNNSRFGEDIWMDPTFTIFICLGDLILLLFMWGVSLYVWRSTGINYIQLLSLQNTDYSAQFAIQPKQVEINILNVTMDLSLIYLVSFLLFNKALRGILTLPGDAAVAHAIPTCLFVYFIYKFFYPFSKRKLYLMMLWKVLMAPMYPVQFRDGYIGDLLTSLVRVFSNLSFSLIYLLLTMYWWMTNHVNAAESVHSPTWQHSTAYRYILIPFLTLSPLWIRLMQCLRRSVETGNRWPHYFNALKYTSAIIVFSFSLFRVGIQQNPLWILGLICATCYQFIWDITMDWGLIQWNNRDQRFEFRKERSLGSTKWYLAIMAGNFLLRFSWAITLMPEDLTRYSTVYSYIYTNFQTLMAAAEIVRRMVWGFLRLEWEYIERYGSAPVPVSQIESLEAERSHMYQRKVTSSQGPISTPFTSMTLDRMEIGSSSSSISKAMNTSSTFLDYCWRLGRHETGEDWEWMEYFGLRPEQIFSEITLRKYVGAGATITRQQWVARMIEGVLLSSIVVLVILFAASDLI